MSLSLSIYIYIYIYYMKREREREGERERERERRNTTPTRRACDTCRSLAALMHDNICASHAHTYTHTHTHTHTLTRASLPLSTPSSPAVRIQDLQTLIRLPQRLGADHPEDPAKFREGQNILMWSKPSELLTRPTRSPVRQPACPTSNPPAHPSEIRRASGREIVRSVV